MAFWAPDNPALVRWDKALSSAESAADLAEGGGGVGAVWPFFDLLKGLHGSIAGVCRESRKFARLPLPAPAKVCKAKKAFGALFAGFGQLFYVLLGSRKNRGLVFKRTAGRGM